MQNLVPTDAIQNSKIATTFLTLGLQLSKPGIFVLYDKAHPKSTGGVAHFIFESSLSNTVQKYRKIYEAGIADVTLDDFLDRLKDDLPADKHAALETHINEALVVYGKKLLDNYNVVIKTVKHETAHFAVVGGEPVYSRGEIAGLQNFAIKSVK